MDLSRSFWLARTAWKHGARNALARVSPRTFSALQRLTRDTGRGDGCAGRAAASYFEAVMDDYRVIADASGVSARPFDGKRVLELGPGDTRAIALLAKLDGATAWEGFDAFDIQSRDARYLDAIYAPLLARRGGDARLLDACTMHTSAETLLAGGKRFDVVVSRAVLEHVRDLRGLFRTLAAVVRDDAVLIHKVDLRSHGVEHRHALDFLCFGDATWHAMSSHVDLPNRARVGEYLALAETAGLRTAWAKTTHVIGRDEAARAAPRLAPEFRALSPDELGVLGLWLVQVGAKHPLATRTHEPLGPAPRDRLSRY